MFRRRRLPPEQPTSSLPRRLRVLDTTLASLAARGVPPLAAHHLRHLLAPLAARGVRLTPDADVQAILSNLKLALSRAIDAFHPLAGRIRLTPGTSDRYEKHYCPGDGVAFTVAEYDNSVVDGLATVDPQEVTAVIAPIVPALPAGGAAVLAIQATLLLSSHGLAMHRRHRAPRQPSTR
nr:unnamed protein product [Digitaria exilis]